QAMTAVVAAGPAGRPRLAALVTFAAAMGWLEAVVVVYIRALLGLAHAETYPPAETVIARMRALPWLVPTEQTRQAATIRILAAGARARAAGGGGTLGRVPGRVGVLGPHLLHRVLHLDPLAAGPGSDGLVFPNPAPPVVVPAGMGTGRDLVRDDRRR